VDLAMYILCLNSKRREPWMRPSKYVSPVKKYILGMVSGQLSAVNHKLSRKTAYALIAVNSDIHSFTVTINGLLNASLN
jgi:hypothetical protein